MNLRASVAAALFAGFAAAVFPGAAHASTMQTYQITLHQNYGTLITGSDFTVTSTPFTLSIPSSGYQLDTPTVTFVIGSNTYRSTLDVAFNGPTVTSIYNFSGSDNGDTLSAISLSSFQLYGSGIGSTIGGAVTFAPATTPLPAALPLFAGGLGLIGLLSLRRKRKAQGALAYA